MIIGTTALPEARAWRVSAEASAEGSADEGFKVTFKNATHINKFIVKLRSENHQIILMNIYKGTTANIKC